MLHGGKNMKYVMTFTTGDIESVISLLGEENITSLCELQEVTRVVKVPLINTQMKKGISKEELKIVRVED